MNKKSMCRAINCLMHAMRASPREGIPLSPSTIPRVCVSVCVYGLWASQPAAIFDNTFVFACGGASGALQQRPVPGRQWAVERLAHTFRYTEH